MSTYSRSSSISAPTNRVGSIVGIVACMGALWAAPALSADYSDEELLAAALEVYNEFSDSPVPYLDREQLARLADHEVVRVRRPGAGGEHREEAVGYLLVEQPRRQVWLAALDPRLEASDLLTEVRLRRDPEGSSQWYQHLDLPWPISDRHWVIDLDKGLALARRTEGFVWEHRWRLAEDGPAIAAETVARGEAGSLTPESVSGAVYLPHNRGNWTLFSLEEGRTLVVYRVSTDVGGSIPESWITTFAMSQLESLLRRVAEHGPEAARRYDPTHHPIADGFGRRIGGRSGEGPSIDAPDSQGESSSIPR